ncbi:MAG: hypothetical protein HG458_006860 [Prevotella sp.]|nr:hypothetical protein [Prevotella sp.]
MKNKITTSWLPSLLFLLAATLISSCSNNGDSLIDDINNAPADPRGSLVSLKLGTAGHVVYNAPMSRATSANDNGRVVSSSSEDLGNGLDALVEVIEAPQNNSEVATTRATSPAPNGTYTIVAFKNGQQKAKWVIKVNNGSPYTFLDGTTEWQYMTPGTYDFYAFNDKVKLENGKFVVKASEASQALYYYSGSAQVSVNPVLKQRFNFVLRPYLSEVKFKIKAFTSSMFEKAITGHFTYAANVIPAQITFDPATGTSNVDSYQAAGNTTDFASFTANMADGANSYIKSHDAKYFMPGVDITKLKFEFKNGISGTVYKKPLSGVKLNISNAINGGLKAGTSYTIAVTIYFRATYLFSDGTTGTMSQKGNRTPVALVVGEKDAVKYAIALKDVMKGVAWTSKVLYKNKEKSSNANAIIDKLDGFHITYDGNTTANPHNAVKAENSNFPVFYFTAKYNPGVPLTGSIANLKWYVGGLGDWNFAMQTLGGVDLKNKVHKRNISYTTDMKSNQIKVMFEQAGGETLDGYYWTANMRGGNIFTIVANANQDFMKISDALKRATDASTRAFIQF